ncbi:hypothetical protein [Gemmobacter nectariphilus]|uniref:hypothetical protein n=1 Tax=Gemmobacter nectariphilus TaxID=220343 RepID=UPI000408F598|nr:hypothetical protein [Gemmobacter nectariphilus]
MLRYRLTPADALAWGYRQIDLTGLRKLGLLAPWIVLGMVWAAAEPLPDLLARGAAAGGAAILAWLVVRILVTRAKRWRAHARVPALVDMICQVRADHLEARPETGDAAPIIIAPQTMHRVLLTSDRLFVEAAPDLLVVPSSAFASPDAMAAFAAHREALSRAAAD